MDFTDDDFQIIPESVLSVLKDSSKYMNIPEMRGFLNAVSLYMLSNKEVAPPLNMHQVVRELIRFFPANFSVAIIPDQWYGFDFSNKLTVDGFKDFYKSLEKCYPEPITEEMRVSLIDNYIYEVITMSRCMKGIARGHAHIGDFSKQGSQYIAMFEVKNLDRKDDPTQVNWHLQNTSQWVYAGCFCVQDGRVSTHH